MAEKQTIVLSSTHLDSQNQMMTKGALEGALSYLNGERRVKMGVEHIRTIPPMGAIINGKLVQGKDNAYYLTGEQIYFDKAERGVLADGTVLIKESFKRGNKPFWDSQIEDIHTLSISTDPANFESFTGFEELMSVLQTDSGLDFEKSMIGRKSHLPDPELIIKLTQTLTIALGLGATKIPQKLGSAIGDDLVKLYKLITRAAIEMIKKSLPANRPKNFVIQYNHGKYQIELVITTNSHDDVLNATSKEKLKCINEKIKLLKNLKPEKIQFLFNEEKDWEFNYLLTKKGEAIGKEKAFKNRNELYKKLLNQQK
jgi:hypothetical protein